MSEKTKAGLLGWKVYWSELSHSRCTLEFLLDDSSLGLRDGKWRTLSGNRLEDWKVAFACCFLLTLALIFPVSTLSLQSVDLTKLVIFACFFAHHFTQRLNVCIY
uniref:Uncharacterized protein n=1 Tax=Schistocephalus solidus TaxID=70667 RepID=A0A0X3P8P5_SCHSO